MKYRTVWIGLAMLLGATSVQATTYVMMRDEDLADQAPVIVRGKVLSSAPAADGTAATEYRVQVAELLKGRARGGVLTVRVPGGMDRNGYTLRVWGAPRFETDERVLLMLGDRPDGGYAPWQLMLGAFHVRSEGGLQLAVRHLAEATELSGAGPDRLRELERFSAWLRDRAAGRKRAPDYLVEMAEDEMQSITGAFTLFVDGSRHLRWFEFERGEDVPFLANAAGQPDMRGRGFDELRASLQPWSADAGTTVRYVYGGTTQANGGLREFDGINAALWDDPFDEISGQYACAQGGTLAVGGPWYSQGDFGTFQGESFIRIGGADIVTNDGAGCHFGQTQQLRAEEVLTHELGHTLGLGHSCGDDSSPGCSDARLDQATMRATAHNDGRGAQIFDDDRAGLAYMYSTGPREPTPVPAPTRTPPPLPQPKTEGGGCGSIVPPPDGGSGGGLGALVLALFVGSLILPWRRPARIPR